MGFEDTLNLKIGLAIWLLVILVVLLVQWKRQARGIGLFLTYLALLWLLHWPGAFIYLFPWHAPDPLPLLAPTGLLVRAGFEQTVYIVIALAIGAIVLAPFFRSLVNAPESSPESAQTALPTLDQRLPYQYMLIGLFSYLILDPRLGRVPTLNALVSVASYLIIAGLYLAWWQAWQAGNRRRMALWLLVGVCYPFFTLAVKGSLVHGLGPATLAVVFAGSFLKRPRRFLLVLTPLIVFVSLSIFVTYMQHRTALRRVLWAETPMTERIDAIYDSLNHPEWFDVRNPSHLRLIDARLNQNILFGSSVYYLSAGYTDYAMGKTIWWSILALVPRVLWPDKPVAAGGSNLASTYTGTAFDSSTSVAVGLPMEFYINYGTLGVIVGCLLLGGLIGLIDMMALHYLRQGDWQRFMVWVLPGIPFITGSALLEVTASAAAAVVVALMVNRLLNHLQSPIRPERHPTPPIHQW